MSTSGIASNKKVTLLLFMFLFGLLNAGCECTFHHGPGECPFDDMGLDLADSVQQIPEPVFVVSMMGTERFSIVVEDEKEDLWSVHADTLANEEKISQFYYGQELAGFTTLISPRPLEIGKKYKLFVTMNVVSGRLDFYVDGEGIIHKEEK